MAEKDLLFTLQYCQQNCLNIDPHVEIQQSPSPDNDAELFGVDGTTFADLHEYVPEELYEYLDIFNDQKAKKIASRQR